MTMRVGSALLAMAVVALGCGVAAQRPAGALDAETRQMVIDGAIAHMRRGYIFEDVAERMAEALRAHAASGAYDRIADPRGFADLLTTHLRAVSRDKHLSIIYDPGGLPTAGPPTANDRAQRLADSRRNNFGFHRVERLEGNVGYLE